jgi:hypothetical protein
VLLVRRVPTAPRQDSQHVWSAMRVSIPHLRQLHAAAVARATMRTRREVQRVWLVQRASSSARQAVSSCARYVRRVPIPPMHQRLAAVVTRATMRLHRGVRPVLFADWVALDQYWDLSPVRLAWLVIMLSRWANQHARLVRRALTALQQGSQHAWSAIRVCIRPLRRLYVAAVRLAAT